MTTPSRTGLVRTVRSVNRLRAANRQPRETEVDRAGGVQPFESYCLATDEVLTGLQVARRRTEESLVEVHWPEWRAPPTPRLVVRAGVAHARLPVAGDRRQSRPAAADRRNPVTGLPRILDVRHGLADCASGSVSRPHPIGLRGSKIGLLGRALRHAAVGALPDERHPFERLRTEGTHSDYAPAARPDRRARADRRRTGRRRMFTFIRRTGWPSERTRDQNRDIGRRSRIRQLSLVRRLLRPGTPVYSSASGASGCSSAARSSVSLACGGAARTGPRQRSAAGRDRRDCRTAAYGH